jgi:hypothetical protein
LLTTHAFIESFNHSSTSSKLWNSSSISLMVLTSVYTKLVDKSIVVYSSGDNELTVRFNPLLSFRGHISYRRISVDSTTGSHTEIFRLKYRAKMRRSVCRKSSLATVASMSLRLSMLRYIIGKYLLAVSLMSKISKDRVLRVNFKVAYSLTINEGF